MNLGKHHKCFKVDGDNITEIELVDFVNLTKSEKISVLRWRNHSAIRQWMYHPEQISLDEHLKFITRLNQNRDKQYFLVKVKEDYLGVIDFVNIDLQQGSCDFGLYANPEISMPHTGRQLMSVAITYAFDVLKLLTLYLDVFSDNVRAIKLYQRFNFSVLEHKELDGKAVLRLSLHHSESLKLNI